MHFLIIIKTYLYNYVGYLGFSFKPMERFLYYFYNYLIIPFLILILSLLVKYNFSYSIMKIEKGKNGIFDYSDMIGVNAFFNAYDILTYHFPK